MKYEFYGWVSDTGEIFGWESTEQEVRWRLEKYGFNSEGVRIVVPELFKKTFYTEFKDICQSIRPDPEFLKTLDS